MDDTQSKERCSKLRSNTNTLQKGGRARRPFPSGRGQRPKARGPALSNEATAATGSGPELILAYTAGNSLEVTLPGGTTTTLPCQRRFGRPSNVTVIRWPA